MAKLVLLSSNVTLNGTDISTMLLQLRYRPHQPKYQQLHSVQVAQ
jgi:hypothetical protein